jgi:hypothetical protein
VEVFELPGGGFQGQSRSYIATKRHIAQVISRLASSPQPFLQPPPCRALVNQLPSPERVNDGSSGNSHDFAFLHHLARSGEVCPTRSRLLKAIENAGFTFVDLVQDETRVAGWRRVGIQRVRELRPFGYVVAQESFLPGMVGALALHPRPVALKNAVKLRHLIGWGKDEECNLNLVVIGHSWFSESNCV